MNPSIRGIRWRLTLWYVGVFTVVMALFGAAVYKVVNRQVELGLNRSLERVVDQRTRLFLLPGLERPDPTLWERQVGVFRCVPPRGPQCTDAEQVWPELPAEPWVADVARAALADTVAKDTVRTRDRRTWLLYGKRFKTTQNNIYATVAVADVVEVRNRYPTTFTGFIASAVIAVLLVGIGGAALAYKSTRPVEATFDQMRRFMSDAAHELKTPVAVMRARADVALQRPRTAPEYQECLEGLAREAERLGSLVENMLLLARADTGQWPVRREKIYLDDILLDAANAARSLGAEKGVVVEVGDLEETQVRGDPTLVRQLFMILLDNAVRYTPEGGRVVASASRRGRRCRVTIADTGIGIPESALPHIYERFFRADTARGRGGAGIGLAIARWIVDMHNARIELESHEGRGTTVEVSFAAA